jgi:hypothetical protein
MRPYLLDWFISYLDDLCEADREALAMVRLHGSKARQVASANLQQALANGDTSAARCLQRISRGIAAIEQSVWLLHH